MDAYFVKIENGVVTNRIVAPSDWDHDDTWVQNDEAQIGWTYTDGEFHPPPTPPPGPVTPEDVNVERDRRIALGVTVQPSGVPEPFVMQTRDSTDFRNINGLSTAAIVLKGLDPSRVIPVRDASDVQHNLTLDQVIEMGLQVQGAISFIYEKSWALKTMDPIPANYTDNSWWV